MSPMADTHSQPAQLPPLPTYANCIGWSGGSPAVADEDARSVTAIAIGRRIGLLDMLRSPARFITSQYTATTPARS
jgi:hypothetical protein